MSVSEEEQQVFSCLVDEWRAAALRKGILPANTRVGLMLSRSGKLIYHEHILEFIQEALPRYRLLGLAAEVSALELIEDSFKITIAARKDGRL